ncbi:kinesin-like protein K39 [Teratosphaeria destructans]|uniref:Kinesin-like protein K39 n=1 Tax=Teratosphaeria destructans TaxID=418781 RepID=A0A9W7W5M5_9PEZI|nr:kinesin-like protein K39 [Teratosphaeria destructans]
MLSLPLIPPQEDPSLFLRTSFRPRPESPPPTNTNQHSQQYRQAQQRRDEERKAHNARSPLALLAADEAAIAQRKAAIRNFGAYWIRPPGISKTLQAMNEEEAERLELEEQARQEQGLLDMQAQQRLAEAHAEGQEAGAEADEAGERDLDEEIPEADEAEGSVTGDVSFNEASMVEGDSHFVRGAEDEEEIDEDEQEALEMEEAELTGAARDQEDLGMDRDLDQEVDMDQSVPEAGSYQHTDTEVEDSSSSEESLLQDSFAQPSTRRSTRRSRGSSTRRSRGRRNGDSSVFGQSTDAAHPLQSQPPGLGSLQERMRAVADVHVLPRSPGSLHLSSSILESSLVGSSPVLQRGQTGGGRGAVRRRGG